MIGGGLFGSWSSAHFMLFIDFNVLNMGSERVIGKVRELGNVTPMHAAASSCLIQTIKPLA